MPGAPKRHSGDSNKGMHGRCVMGVIKHLVGRVSHRAGLVTDPV